MTCIYDLYIWLVGGRVGLVVRALAFHQCDPGSISALGVGGSSFLVLYSAMRGFSPGTPVFPSHQKPTFDLIWFVNNNCNIVNVDLISSTIVKRIWSYSYDNLRYRNVKHYYYYHYSSYLPIKQLTLTLLFQIKVTTFVMSHKDFFLVHSSFSLLTRTDIYALISFCWQHQLCAFEINRVCG